jgi:phosphate transport system permease protein
VTTIDMHSVALLESRRKMQAWRRQKNRLALFLSMATMVFGLFWLVWILFSTVTKGIDGMSHGAVHRNDSSAEYREGGGLANAIAGSRPVLILWATVFGTPLGIMAGIYLAEYGRKSWLAKSSALLTTSLLSAPSIVVGPVRVHHRGCQDATLLRLGRDHRVSSIAGTDRDPYHREYAETGAGYAA